MQSGQFCVAIDRLFFQARWTFREITPDEYDRAAQHRPELCPLRALGDPRSGRELLADFDADCAVTLEDLAAAAAGRRFLEQLPARLLALARHMAAASVGGQVLTGVLAQLSRAHSLLDADTSNKGRHTLLENGCSSSSREPAVACREDVAPAALMQAGTAGSPSRMVGGVAGFAGDPSPALPNEPAVSRPQSSGGDSYDGMEVEPATSEAAERISVRRLVMDCD